MSRPIALVTDLGSFDDAVGMCKGVMLRRSPRSQIVDVTHHVPPFNVQEAGLYLGDLPLYFPDDTVFCVIVFPETGTRPCIAARNKRGQLLLAGDNGVLTWARQTVEFDEVRRIDNHECMIYPPTPSFHGRDILATCTGLLANGYPLADVGPAVDEIELLPLHTAHYDGDGSIAGMVTIIDKNFGNVWTNVPAALCDSARIRVGSLVTVEFEGREPLTMPYCEVFGNVPVGMPLAYLNSRERLSFACNKANLQQIVNVTSATPVRISAAGAGGTVPSP